MRQALRPELRAFYVITVVIVVTFGALLFLVPGGTDEYWTWIIGPINSAYLIGSAYVAATVYYLIILRTNDWPIARNGVGGLIVFSIFLLGATMLHWTRLRPYHPTTLIWLVTYYVPPLALPILFRLQQSGAMPELDTRALAPAWRTWVVGRGAVYSLLAVAGFVFAGQLSQLWPWPVDPLDLRIFTGQVALNGWAGLIARSDGFVWRRQRMGFLLVAVLGLAQLAGIALGRATYAWSSALGPLLPLMFLEWSVTGFALLATYGWRDDARRAPSRTGAPAL